MGASHLLTFPPWVYVSPAPWSSPERCFADGSASCSELGSGRCAPGPWPRDLGFCTPVASEASRQPGRVAREGRWVPTLSVTPAPAFVPRLRSPPRLGRHRHVCIPGVPGGAEQRPPALEQGRCCPSCVHVAGVTELVGLSPPCRTADSSGDALCTQHVPIREQGHLSCPEKLMLQVALRRGRLLLLHRVSLSPSRSITGTHQLLLTVFIKSNDYQNLVKRLGERMSFLRRQDDPNDFISN